MMAVKIITNEKNVLEIELEGMDQALAQLLAEKLNADSSVEFAAFKVDHPLISKPHVYVRVKKGDPAKLVLVKLDEIRNELSEFRDKFSSIVK